MDDRLIEFRDYLRGRYSSAETVNTYFRSAVSFLRWSKGRVKGELLTKYLTELEGKGRKQTTLSTHYHAIKSLFVFLKKENEITAARFSSYREEEPRVATDEETKKIAAIATESRERVLVMLLYSTALRRSEIFKLTVDDLRTPGTLRVQRSKKSSGAKYEYLPLDPPVSIAIKDYLMDYGIIEGTLFPFKKDKLYRILKDLCKRAGVEYKNPHAFRHGRLDDMLNKKGTPLAIVSKFAGHKSVNTTMHYSHTTLEDLRNAVPATQWNVGSGTEDNAEENPQ